MRSFLLSLIVVFWPVSVCAQPTEDSVRELAYAGDVDGLEAAFADAHARSLNGDMTFDALRNLVGALTTTHPTFIETTDAWLNAYPGSPYAHALRAFQFRRYGWNIRGEGLARGKRPEVLQMFSDYQWAAVEHALIAYQEGPDFVPASDAIFRMQPATRALPKFAILSILGDVMRTAPNLGSIERAAGMAAPGWGGGGLADVVFICETYAKVIPDPGYDQDICRVHLAYIAGLREDDDPLIWEGIGERTHPAIDWPWAVRVTTDTYQGGFGPDSLARVERYLTGSGQWDAATAVQYMYTYDMRRPEAEALVDEVAEQVMARARDRIIHDPLNPELISILLHQKYPSLMLSVDRGTSHFSETSHILRLRLAAARPYDAMNWISVAQTVKRSEDDLPTMRALPYFGNALHYSDYDLQIMGRALVYIIDAVTSDHASRAPAETEVSITQDTPPQIACAFVRLDRIASHVCRSAGRGFDRCPATKQYRPAYDRLIAEARSTGMCLAEQSASFADLKFTPAQIDLDELMTPLVWD